MARPSPERLLLASYPVRIVIPTRFQDLDAMGHINNVAFAALFEDARVRFNRALGRMDRADGLRAVVARNEVNYLAEGSYPDDVEIATGVTRIGNRSWDVAAVMHQHGRAIATCDTTLVMTHPAQGGIPADFRTRLDEVMVRAG
ncbi:acyl-CoA thioesterase [uncultured Sphingomonas sp.]|jgi:acyl-CoA thioester hydrolase|uniref:acyl-CoA thioesterase n=1 Tax=uncultured Sphingomonas sp. TaxID=158754 RepID=UPI0030DDC027